MISFKISGESANPNVPLRVDGGMLVVSYAKMIEAEFGGNWESGGVLAHPTVLPTDADPTEIRFAAIAPDGTDLLDENTGRAIEISAGDAHQLVEGMNRLREWKTGGGGKTAEFVVKAFRLPDFNEQPECYRLCTDRASGKKRLAVIWGIGNADKHGSLISKGVKPEEPSDSVRKAIPMISARESTHETGRTLLEGVTPSLGATKRESPAPSVPLPEKKGSKWPFLGLGLLLVAMLAMAFLWWKATDREQLLENRVVGLTNEVAALRLEVAGLRNRLDQLLGAPMPKTVPRMDDTPREKELRSELSEEQDSLIKYRSGVPDDKKTPQERMLTEKLGRAKDVQTEVVLNLPDHKKPPEAKPSEEKYVQLKKELETLGRDAPEAKEKEAQRQQEQDKIIRIYEKKPAADKTPEEKEEEKKVAQAKEELIDEGIRPAPTAQKTPEQIEKEKAMDRTEDALAKEENNGNREKVDGTLPSVQWENVWWVKEEGNVEVVVDEQKSHYGWNPPPPRGKVVESSYNIYKVRGRTGKGDWVEWGRAVIPYERNTK